MMFTQSKSPLQSLGVLGGGGGIVIGVASLVGISLSAEDVVQAKDLAFSVATTIMGAIALYGRIRAKTRIGLID
jgi:hypothetical protein